MDRVVIACKRPNIEVSDQDALETGAVKDRCVTCKCEVYILPKNQEIQTKEIMCFPCAKKEMIKEQNRKGEEALIVARNPDDLIKLLEAEVKRH